MIYLLFIGFVIQQSLANPSEGLEDVHRKITVLMKQFSVLNEELTMVKQTLTVQYDENQTMKQKILLVTDENVKLSERVDKLSDKNRIMNNIVKQLLEERYAVNYPTSAGNNRTEEENLHRTEFETTVSERRLPNDMMKNLNNDDLTQFSKQKRLLLPSNNPSTTWKVAFSVSLTHRIQLGQHQIVKYDKVNTNVGNAYDIRHAHFIVPTRGVYLLSFTVMNVKGEYLYLEVVKNSEQIALVYGGQNDYNMGSETIVHLLEKGDVVWVRHTHDNTPTINGDDPFNTFTGVLLFEMRLNKISLILVLYI